MTENQRARVYPARSMAEALLWAEFDACECGGLGVGWELSAVYSVTATTCEIELESACAKCAGLRRLGFVLPSDEEPARYHFARPGDPSSELYDAGEWWAFAQEYGRVADEKSRALAAGGWRDHQAR
ncbi:MAG: hypothetical protein JOY78_05820, partial [Pseudonocardia sp.]|nr:hypothetical protein [Pseudonocardia sp.]